MKTSLAKFFIAAGLPRLLLGIATILTVAICLTLGMVWFEPQVQAAGLIRGYPLVFSQGKQLTGDFVPNSLTTITTGDAYVFHISLSNTTGTATTCTIQDLQATPRAYFPTVSIAANTVYDDNPNGRYFQGGITWSCTAANAVIGEIWWKVH